MIDEILIIAGLTVLVMVTPGPDMVIVLRSTLVAGRSAGLQSSFGVLTGNLVHVTYCAVGIGWLISKSVVAFSVLKYAGAAYLIYLGLTSLLRRPGGLNNCPSNDAQQKRPWFVQGFLNNVLNPKGTLFYLGVFTVVITPETGNGVTLLLVAVMMSISTIFWILFVYTLDGSLVRGLLGRGGRWLDRVFGGLLILLGLRVAFLDR